MRALTYYVAATLDGYIAGPYSHLEQYVVSSALRVEDPDVQVVSDPVALVRELKLRDGMGIWLAGGGKLAAALQHARALPSPLLLTVCWVRRRLDRHR